MSYLSLLAFVLTSFQSLLMPFLFTFKLFPAVFKLAFSLNVDSLLLSLFPSHINKCTFFFFYFFFHFSFFPFCTHPPPPPLPLFLLSFDHKGKCSSELPDVIYIWSDDCGWKRFSRHWVHFGSDLHMDQKEGSRVYMGIVRVSVCEPYCARFLMHYFRWTRWICLGSVWCTGIHTLLRRI